ncbi:hypothetical protein KAU39_08500, partial [bacterium]|nr:hypothetical protein [bacterium]
KGLYERSLEICREAIKIKPDRADIHFVLGSTYLKLDKKEEASVEYGILKELDKKLAGKLLKEINRKK